MAWFHTSVQRVYFCYRRPFFHCGYLKLGWLLYILVVK